MSDGSVLCAKCNHHELYFKTAQLRSADEGQTIFYECAKCAYVYFLQRSTSFETYQREPMTNHLNFSFMNFAQIQSHVVCKQLKSWNPSRIGPTILCSNCTLTLYPQLRCSGYLPLINSRFQLTDVDRSSHGVKLFIKG